MAVQSALNPSLGPALDPVSPTDIIPTNDQLLKKLIIPWTTGLKATWTGAQIRSALLQHRQGILDQSSQLYDSLLEDDEFPGTLARRVNASLESEFSFCSAEGEDVELTKREQKIEKLFPEISPDDELFDMWASWLVLGVGVGTLDWDTSGPIWMPRLRALPTQFLYYDQQLQCFKYQARDSEPLIVTPGDGKWVLFTHGQRSWMWGLLRGLAMTWLGKQMTFCDWQRYSQKHGLPIIKAMIPIWRDDDEKAKFVADLGDLISEGVVGLPQDENSSGQTTGYDIELLEATTVSWQGFQAALERADRKMQVQLLGGNLGAEVTKSGGNMGAAATHSGEVAKLAGGDQTRIGSMLRRQVLGPLFSLNYGVPLTSVPTPYWDSNPENVGQLAQNQFTVAQAIAALSTAGVEIQNLDQVGRMIKMKLSPVVKVAELPGNTPPPAPVVAPAGARPKAKPAGKKKK